MRKLVLGMSAMVLVASAAAFAGEEDNARVATAESMTPSFTKLDADGDGRISAIEAANNSRVAAGFTSAAFKHLATVSRAGRGRPSSRQSLDSFGFCDRSPPSTEFFSKPVQPARGLATRRPPSAGGGSRGPREMA